MRRREFLQAAMVPLIATQVPSADGPGAEYGDLRKFRIAKVTGFRHRAVRPHVAGKNAYKGVHGGEVVEGVLRVGTDAGVEGFGAGDVKPEAAKALVGHTLDEFWKPGVGVVSPLGRADHALYDLMGKALGLPASALLGQAGPHDVPVYDGSIYFNDLEPESEGRSGVPRVVHEFEKGLKAGHTAFKIKVGRGFKWMDKEEGFRRDLEVVRALRAAAGKDVLLMADANNGFDPATAERFVDEVGSELFFLEEPFPEDVAKDLALKGHLRAKRLPTLVADGESARDADEFDALIAREAIDVYQPDIRAFGLTRQLGMSRKLAAKPGLRLAPHNWGSFLGLYMQLTLAPAIPNFLRAEQDPCASDLFDASAFPLKGGMIRVPATPGCGLVLREDVYRANYAKDAWAVG